VFARALSAAKNERVAAAKVLKADVLAFKGDKRQLVDDLRQALYAAKIISYAQGYQLLRAAAKAYRWNLNYGSIALVWRAGCIIRSAFLGEIKRAFDRDRELVNLLLDPFFKDAVSSRQAGWRRAVVAAVQSGIPVPCLSAALAYFDGYRAERLPANLLQAQRDFFGAHTYERLDRPRGEFFHTNWTGHGGDTTSRSYSA
jgi:6-phosphogluconate dehydrogenase